MTQVSLTLPLLLGSSLSPEGQMEVSSWKTEARGQKPWQGFKGLACPSYRGHLCEVPVPHDTGDTVSVHRPESLKPRNKDVTVSGESREPLTPQAGSQQQSPQPGPSARQHQGLPGCIGAEGRVPGTGAQNLTGPRRAGRGSAQGSSEVDTPGLGLCCV